MGEHWHKHKRIKLRMHDRPTSGKRIGGRTCWGRDDQAIRAARIDKLIIDTEIKSEHSGALPFVQNHIVKGCCLGNDLFIADHLNRVKPPLLLSELSKQCLPDLFYRSDGRISVRNPNVPRLIPRTGVPKFASARLAPSKLPSPPTTMAKSTF